MPLNLRMTFGIKKSLFQMLGLRDPGHPLIVHAHRARRKILRSDKRLREDYLSTAAKPKLQIGGGCHQLDGWLNTDVGLVPKVMLMDATCKFPFRDGIFEYVYTEHMIEHISYEMGVCMLRECHRVMRDGGIIRVVTPDLVAITGLGGDELSDAQQRYLLWFCNTFIPQGYPKTSTTVINAFFRMWGHQFIYDEETLADAMCKAGFSSVNRWRLGESCHRDLQNLENTQRYPDGLLNFESMALEGRK